VIDVSVSEETSDEDSERGPGWPRVEVDVEAVHEDLEAGMSIQATAKKHGISRRTLRRRWGARVQATKGTACRKDTMLARP
jgi:transcriptional regulator GlxA family with amidase domain